jgi:hypothetical protein
MFDKIPVPYAIKDLRDIVQVSGKKLFLPDLTRINDNIANGIEALSIMKPLSLFSAERTDFSYFC